MGNAYNSLNDAPSTGSGQTTTASEKGEERK